MIRYTTLCKNQETGSRYIEHPFKSDDGLAYTLYEARNENDEIIKCVRLNLP